MKPFLRSFTIFAALLLASSVVIGEPNFQVLWKLVDKTGRITYADKAPAATFDGQVTRIEVDLNANRARLMPLGEPSASAASLPLTSPELSRVKLEAELASAREQLELARKALADGNQPTPEETRWVGNKRGGARPVPTDDFAVRLKGLEDAVKAAEAQVDRAQRAVRRAAID